ncbi:MAG TPA: ABC transporter ATP-binding protein [Candidatus Solibacter sp.]|nr:ABC transporter ATP-binding protein [Candidatus Solibacter sp.]
MLREPLTRISWDSSELPLLLESLAAAIGFRTAGVTGETLPPPTRDEDTAEWIEAAGRRLGLETVPDHTRLRDVERTLESAAPVILALPDRSYVGMLSVRNGKARLIARDLRTRTVTLAALRDALCAPAEERYTSEVDAVIAACEAGRADLSGMRRALLRERAGAAQVALGWQLRVPPGSSFRSQMTQSGLHTRAFKFAAAYSVEYVLTLGAWWLLGRAALSGRFDRGWLLAWALMMTCSVVFRSWKTASSEALAVSLGGLLKQRLIAGAMRLDPDSVRHEGAGGMLARIMEAEALHSLALSGGLAALVAPIELIFAGALLWLGAAGVWHAILLAATAAVLGTCIWRNQHLRGQWTDARLAMTGNLVERMHGHRTRLAQEHPAQWHAGEDTELAHYVECSSALDGSTAIVNTLVPRLWLLLGLAALIPAFLRSDSPTRIAMSIAAVLLAHRSLQTLGAGLGDLSGARLAWRRIGPLFRAASKAGEPGIVTAGTNRNGEIVLDARDLSFRYRQGGDAILRDCTLRIRSGDWILLEGASGNGKSTLASIMAGLRAPGSGLLLAGGLDYKTLGEARWRRRISYAPQSHDNYIFAGSLAFNLLMGRSWPPRRQDLADAHRACEELGLGGLLARMPAGLDQIVGESGWQLSEGERGRIFLARALLAGADLLVLDECFSALDPESLELAFRALRQRAAAVVMVAHR